MDASSDFSTLNLCYQNEWAKIVFFLVFFRVLDDFSPIGKKWKFSEK